MTLPLTFRNAKGKCLLMWLIFINFTVWTFAQRCGCSVSCVFFLLFIFGRYFPPSLPIHCRKCNDSEGGCMQKDRPGNAKPSVTRRCENGQTPKMKRLNGDGFLMYSLKRLQKQINFLARDLFEVKTTFNRHQQLFSAKDCPVPRICGVCWVGGSREQTWWESKTVRDRWYAPRRNLFDSQGRSKRCTSAKTHRHRLTLSLRCVYLHMIISSRFRSRRMFTLRVLQLFWTATICHVDGRESRCHEQVSMKDAEDKEQVTEEDGKKRNNTEGIFHFTWAVNQKVSSRQTKRAG